MLQDNQLLSQKTLFFKYLEERNLLMLKNVLPDSAEYFGASKKEFLKKLLYIDNQITLAGSEDKFAIVKHKKHVNTYYLKTPIISFCNKFIIDEVNGKILTIYNPSLKTSKLAIYILHPLEFFFEHDQRINFKPSHCYINQLNFCTNSYNKMVNNGFQILTVHDISVWIGNNEKIYQEVKQQFLMFRFNNFKILFKTLKYIYKKLKNVAKVLKAIETFPENDSEQMEKWIDDYYLLALYKLDTFKYNFVDVDLSKNIFKSSHYSNINFKGNEFLKFFEFNELYHKNYKQLKHVR